MDRITQGLLGLSRTAYIKGINHCLLALAHNLLDRITQRFLSLSRTAYIKWTISTKQNIYIYIV